MSDLLISWCELTIKILTPYSSFLTQISQTGDFFTSAQNRLKNEKHEKICRTI